MNPLLKDCPLAALMLKQHVGMDIKNSPQQQEIKFTLILELLDCLGVGVAVSDRV